MQLRLSWPQPRFILIETSHAGNVGAVARAMKVMGFEELVLVAPRWPNVLRKEECIQRASGAVDVLERARIVATLDEALEGVHQLCATAMVARDFGPPTQAPRAHLQALAEGQFCPPCKVGFLFGSERYGMKNEDVYRCHVALSIPTQPGFGSLNLAAAVQLIAYEWRMAIGGFDGALAAGVNTGLETGPESLSLYESTPRPPANLADASQVAGMLAHWEEALTDVGFLDPDAPKKLMPRLQQLFNRSALTEEEIHILRGIAKAMQGRSRKTPSVPQP